MKIDNRHLAKLTIQELFEKGDKYLIPIYQRNYEWGESHIKQLIDDIKDYFEQEHDKNYYIGTLIVDEREINHTNYFETVDGQQRLTTLNIICCALKAMNNIVCKNIFQSPNISFESRKLADETLSFISQKGLKQPTFENFNENIFEGLKIAYKELDSIKKSMNENFDDFVHYFFTKVILIRVQVPEDTDLNHYFEIMNSRGEQLEKHEVLKSRLMKHLNMHPYPEDARKIFNHIWEACADMNTYVQLLFDKEM
ncbi:DUF262 domain-containing protein, partial [Bacteroidales bacterium OttesenSCG-928-L19]|nr:DUF262 domain-containing protein [Bacteroidales bacterium OttesenSCG-928-L19]